jgi:hypothetical protein
LEVGEGTTISQIMHALNSRYTKLYGKRYQRSGHLFQGRYRSTVLEKDLHLVPLTRYLHAQPDALATSLPQYIRPETSWLDRDEVLQHFGSRLDYQAYVEAAIPEELEQWRRTLEQPVVGSKEFLRYLAKGPTTDPQSDAVAQPACAVPTRAIEIQTARWQKTLSVVVLAGLIYSAGRIAFLPDHWKEIPTGPALPSLNRSIPNPTLAAMLPKAEPQPVSITSAVSQLSGTAWVIQLTPMYGREDGKLLKDRICFQSNRFSSAAMEQEGFPSSNMTVTFSEDGRTVWETMQTHPNGEKIFWRGEMRDGQMRGIFSRHPTDGMPKDFVFRGVLEGLDQKKEEQTL